MKVYRIFTREDDFFEGSVFRTSNYIFYFPRFGLLIRKNDAFSFSDSSEEIKQAQNDVDNGRAKYELEVHQEIVAAIISRGKQFNIAKHNFQEAVQNLEQAVKISGQNLE